MKRFLMALALTVLSFRLRVSGRRDSDGWCYCATAYDQHPYRAWRDTASDLTQQISELLSDL